MLDHLLFPAQQLVELRVPAFEMSLAICRRLPPGPERDEWLAWVERARGGVTCSLPQQLCCLQGALDR
jgi:hypothetical protein